MNIEYSSIITLSDKREYIVVGKVEYNKREYLYLVDIHNNTNTKIVLLRETSVLELDQKRDIDLINTLLPLFLANAKEYFESAAD